MEIVQTLRSVSVFVMEDSMCMTRCNTTLIRVFSTSLKLGLFGHKDTSITIPTLNIYQLFLQFSNVENHIVIGR